MSIQAKRFNRRSLSAAEAATDGFDISNPEACQVQVSEYAALFSSREESILHIPGLPEYWQAWHYRQARFWATRFNLSWVEVRGVLEVFFRQGVRTDEVGCWGPSIETLLRTAKTMGISYFPIFCREANFARYNHLGEAFFWNVQRYNRTYDEETDRSIRAGKNGRVQGLSSRRWRYWKLLTNLEGWHINTQNLSFPVIKGIDRLSEQPFRIARAMLRAMERGAKVKSAEFFTELCEYLNGTRSLSELVEFIPRGDAWIIFGNEDDKELVEENCQWMRKSGLYISPESIPVSMILGLSQARTTEKKKFLLGLRPAHVEWAIWRTEEGEFSSLYVAIKAAEGRLEFDSFGNWVDKGLPKRYPCQSIDMVSYPHASITGMGRTLFIGNGREVVYDVEYRSQDEFWMALESIHLELDTTDGVEVYLDQTEAVIHGVTVRKGWTVSRGETSMKLVLTQKSTGRSFHTDWYDNWGKKELKNSVKQAIRAWRRRAELERREANLVAFLNGEDGFMPLIRFSDSRSAGNCAAGTQSWIDKHGWGSRKWIPAM